jgi:hypothetical protein
MVADFIYCLAVNGDEPLCNKTFNLFWFSKYHRGTVFIVGMSNVLKIRNIKYKKQGEVYLISIIGSKNCIDSCTDILD